MSISPFGTYVGGSGGGSGAVLVPGPRGPKGDSGVIMASDPLVYTAEAQSIAINSASINSSGVVSIGDQTFKGVKTFSDSLKLPTLSPGTVFVGANGVLSSGTGTYSTVSHSSLSDKDSGTYLDGGHTNLTVTKSSTSDPTTADSAYKIGTIWINTTNDQSFVCVDNTANAAVWKNITDVTTLNVSSITASGGTLAIYGNETVSGLTTATGGLKTDTITPIGATITLNSNTSIAGNLTLTGAKELLFSADSDTNKIVLYDSRAGVSNSTLWYGIGASFFPSPHADISGSPFSVTFHTRYKDRPFIFTGTNTDGGATETAEAMIYNDTFYIDKIKPLAAGALTIDGNMTVSGNTTISGNVAIANLKELKFSSTIENDEEKSRIIYLDNRGADEPYAWAGYGAAIVSGVGFSMISQINHHLNPYIWYARNNDTKANIEMLRLQNKVLYIDTLQKLAAATLTLNSSTTINGDTTVNGNLSLGGNELLFSSSNDRSKIILLDNRGGVSNSDSYHGIGCDSNRMTFNTAYSSNDFTWGSGTNIRAALGGNSTGVGDKAFYCGSIYPVTLYRVSGDATALPTTSTMSIYGTTLDIKGNLKLSNSTTYPTAGYLYRNADGTTAIQTPGAGETSAVDATANTLVKRDGSGNIQCGTQIQMSNGSYFFSDMTQTKIAGPNFANLNIASYDQNVIRLGYNEPVLIGGSTAKNEDWVITTSDKSHSNSYILLGNQIRRTVIGTPDNLIGTWNSSLNRVEPTNNTFIYRTQIHGIFGKGTISAGNTVYCDENGYVGTPVSSRRFKENIIDINDTITDNVWNLRPVQFNYIGQAPDNIQYGLIAEEVEETLGRDFCVYQDGVVNSVLYPNIPIVTLKAVQKLKRENDELKTKVATLENDMALMKQQISMLMSGGSSNVSFQAEKPAMVEDGKCILYDMPEMGTVGLGWRVGNKLRYVNV